MEVLLRAVQTADEPFLDRLYADVHAAEFAPLNLPPPALAQLLAMQARMQRTSYAVTFPGALDQLILRAAEPVGRLLTVELPDQIHLIDIALLTEVRRQEIGATLLRQQIERARQSRKPLTLSVRLENPAQDLYLRLGFMPTGNDGMNLTMRHDGGPQP
jgi:ribosomal protein S18 acetylase RimI-like enzyme